MKDRFDIVSACDTGHNQYGIVTRSAGLLPQNDYLSVSIDYLFQHCPAWPKHAAIEKTVACSQLIDHIATKLGRNSLEMPIGFK